MVIGNSVEARLDKFVFISIYDLVRRSVYIVTRTSVMITVRDSMWTIIFVRDGDR